MRGAKEHQTTEHITTTFYIKQEKEKEPKMQIGLHQELIVLSYDKHYKENKAVDPNEVNNEEEEENYEDASIPWANLIFLPFHPIFELIVLSTVIFMSVLGPMKAVFPFMYCKSLIDDYVGLRMIKFYYKYCCSPIFIIDVVLHMLHRQITTEARRREYLPKSELCLLLDFIVCIPFYQMTTVTENDECPEFQFWPNILAFTEFLLVYRVVEYFSLLTTHSIINITVGSIILWFIVVNCLTCIHLIVTKIGYCDDCHKRIYDWRLTIVHKLNETDVRYTSYVYGMAFVISYTGHRLLDTIKPFTLGESFFAIFLMAFGYVIVITCVKPKIICEAMLYIRRIIEYKPKVNRIIAEVARRNPEKRSSDVVESFYALIWTKRSGLTQIPEVTLRLPRYIRVEICLDLFWQVFYHSPIFRTTSNSFKRLLSEYIRLDYKLPGERFFVGPQAQTHLYYIKSGLVQLISADDGTTSLLSMTSGTIFGDISFLVPPIGRTVEVRCVTYCEVVFISRFCLLNALCKFPHDRREVMKRAYDRIKHAETLSKCKELVRGLDRAEDENFYWIKKRWWELSDAIDAWKKNTSDKAPISCTLAPDEMPYHCTKYIGQLVLCTEAQLHRKSMFAKFTFPWVLLPNSLFNVYWHQIVILTVYLVLVLFPPNISRMEPYSWFHVMEFRADSVYGLDLLILMMTAVIEQEVGQSITFSDVLFARFKTFSFWLDVLATIWIESWILLIHKPQLYWISMYNRLLKVKILFVSEIQTVFDSKVSTLMPLLSKIVLVIFCYCYVGGYIFAYIERRNISLTTTYWMGEKICPSNITKEECDPELIDVLYLSYFWLFNVIFTSYAPQTLMDIYFGILISMTTNVLLLICMGTVIAAFYLTEKEIVEYQNFVSNLKKFYKIYKIHPDLMMRLDAYMVCHWKYYKGMDIMKPNILMSEPFDIYWRAHGELAMRIIANCGAFKGADGALIRELAYKTKFLLRPKNTTIAVFGVQTKNVTWLAQGWIKCEYHDQEGEIRKKYLSAGALISPTSIFLGTPSFRTYTTYTTCETLFIKVKDFYAILKRYPNEWVNIQNAIKEYGDMIRKTHQLIAAQHADYETKLQERVFHAHMDIYANDDEETEEEDTEGKDDLKNIFGLFFHDPQSKFITTWCMVRAIAAFVIVICATLQGITGTTMTAWAEFIEIICTLFIAADIFIKFTTGYYTEEGILVHDLKSCALHYASRTLLIDLVACIHMHKLLEILDLEHVEYKNKCIINTVTKLVTQLYVIIGYLNYLADVPSNISAYIKILKWQIIMVLLRFASSQYFFSLCFEIDVNETTSEITLLSTTKCWLPTHIQIDKQPSFQQQLLVLAESFIISECGFLRLNLGMLNVQRARAPECLLLGTLGILFWFVTAYTITMLCLCKRKNATFRYGVTQLRQFLQAERVDEKTVDKVLAHFKYLWMRTDGIYSESLMQERIGVVFRRDLSYFFYSRTLHALNTILKGDEYMLKRISGELTVDFFMRGEDIIRQDDLNNTIYIVNRGIVGVAIDGEQVAVLTKGSIFGLLDGTTARPSRIWAYALEHTDVMQLTAKDFEDEVDAPVAEYIKSAYSTFKQDYIRVKKPVAEDPRNTIPYLLRGKKIIQLPWMKEPEDAQKGDSWYRMWLATMWVISPTATASTVMFLTTMPSAVKWSAVRFLFISDALHILFLCGEYFTLRVVIVEDRCIYRLFGTNLFKDPITYVSIFSIVAPIMSYATDEWLWQLARVVRLRLLYNFHSHFCKTFRTSITPTIMKLIYILLILHVVTIGWMLVSCRSWDGEYKYLKPVFYTIPGEINHSIDYTEWTSPSERYGYGCKRLTIPYTIPGSNNTFAYSYVVAKNWKWDYLVAINYIIVLYTQTDSDMDLTEAASLLYWPFYASFFFIDASKKSLFRANVVPFTPSQAFFNCFITLAMYFLSVWVISSAVSYVYMNIRQLYNFDYNIQSLIIYLKQAGLSSALLESVVDYTSQLWKRQSGNWLPNLALETSLCLKEDILGALYMHHLTGPPLFQHLPPYFLRQLVTKLRRIVIFPGKCVVNQNDIYGCIYFIHDGEVEKWYTDPVTGERKLVSYLFTCDYFGLMPGLFPDEPHAYSYVTRSVTDFVCLLYKDWQDLRNGYPDIRERFYDIAIQVRKRENLIANHRDEGKNNLNHERED